MIIDTHCHIDMYPKPIETVNESERLGIITIGMTNLPSHFKMGQPHLKGYNKTRLALGMHPLLAKHHLKEFPLFYECFNKTSYIGEVGLDFSKEGIKTKDLQIDSFKRILETVGSKPKILSIHSRKAEKQVLEMLKENQIRNAIFHWYSGGLNLIDEIIDAGYYLSVNPAMLNSESGQKIIQRIPKQYILTESDGPFIEINKRPAKPKDIESVLIHLSAVYNCKVSDVENIIATNFKALLNQMNLEHSI